MLIGLLVCAVIDDAGAADKITIRHHEVMAIGPDTLSSPAQQPSQRSAPAASAQASEVLSFSAFGRGFRLTLASNEALMAALHQS